MKNNIINCKDETNYNICVAMLKYNDFTLAYQAPDLELWETEEIRWFVSKEF
jgi:hypothetical protein